jgi:hypothetical protein
MECEANNFGMAQIINNDVVMILIGPKRLTPNQAALVAMWSLLEGIMKDTFSESNEEEAQKKAELKHWTN